MPSRVRVIPSRWKGYLKAVSGVAWVSSTSLGVAWVKHGDIPALGYVAAAAGVVAATSTVAAVVFAKSSTPAADPEAANYVKKDELEAATSSYVKKHELEAERFAYVKKDELAEMFDAHIAARYPELRSLGKKPEGAEPLLARDDSPERSYDPLHTLQQKEEDRGRSLKAPLSAAAEVNTLEQAQSQPARTPSKEAKGKVD